MKIIATSDIHGLLMNPNDMPQGDVLSLCGDIVPLDIQNSLVKSIAWFHLKFYPWVKSLPYDKIIFIGGNHDFFLNHLHKHNISDTDFIWRDSYNVMNDLFCNEYDSEVSNKLIYLCDNSIEYKNVKFYGTPYIKGLKNWAFYRNNDDIKTLFNQIPDCDVLITHQPPKVGDIGRILEISNFHYMHNFGSEELYDVIKERNIKWSLSGHIHSGSHEILNDSDTNFVNVSLRNEDYKKAYDLFEFEI